MLPGEGVYHRHAVVVCIKDRNSDCWLADAGSETGTFVNGIAVVCRRLVSGDLVRIGPYAWTFESRLGTLEPVDGVDGMAIEMDGAAVRGRLEPLRLRIEPGEIVAVVGPSGAGKSTFVKVLIGEPGVLDEGRVLADGKDVADDPDGFRGRLGYVPQERALHGDLTAREVVEFSAHFRGTHVDPKKLLRLVDLDDSRHGAYVRELSGGQEKRVRIAAELVAAPGLLVLDEPGSGLDPAREAEVLRLLGRLRDRGCTVVVVTHNLGQLAAFSRVLVLRDKRLVFDGSPKELRKQAPAGDVAALDLRKVKPNVEPTTASGKPARPRRRKYRPATAWFGQAWQLVRRELALLDGRRIRLPVSREGTPGTVQECVVPLLLAPVFFAFALHFAVNAHVADVATLGFLAVLSSIWMGASLSLMSIVNEREVFDHERLLFLRVGCYVTAKTLVLYVLTLVQSLVFVALLSWLRGGSEARGMLYAGAWSSVYFPLVGCAGAGLGMFISAVSRRSKPAANFVLPLAMIAQIVFSVQVAVDGKLPFHKEYGQFSLHQCERIAVHPAGRRAEVWLAPEQKTAIQRTPNAVNDARTPARAVSTADDSRETAMTELSPGWYCADCIERPLRRQPPPRSDGESRFYEDEDRKSDQNRPNLAATWCSYLTISRYADVALRTFAYDGHDAKVFLGAAEQPSDGSPTIQERFGYRRWRQEATAVLLLFAVGLPFAVALVLTWQTNPRWQALPRRLTTAWSRRFRTSSLISSR